MTRITDMSEALAEVFSKDFFSAKKEIVKNIRENIKHKKPIKIPELFSKNSELILSTIKNNFNSIPITYKSFKTSVDDLNDLEKDVRKNINRNRNKENKNTKFDQKISNFIQNTAVLVRDFHFGGNYIENL